jgi:hypothetical protein
LAIGDNSSNTAAAAPAASSTAARALSRICLRAFRNAVPDRTSGCGFGDFVTAPRMTRTPHSSHPAIRRATPAISLRRDRISAAARSSLENIVNSFMGTTEVPLTRAKCSTTAS